MSERKIHWGQKSPDIFEGVPIVTLSSDFGDRWSVAQVELAIHRVNPAARLIELARITPFSITEGAFVLAKSYKQAPHRSVHIGVVDPGVGTERKGLIIKTNDYWFVGPNNGLLFPAAVDNGIEHIYSINNGQVNFAGLKTFHGRDIFAPVAGRLLNGEHPEGFASLLAIDQVVERHFKPTEVVHVDRYGNIKLAGTPEALDRRLLIGDQILVETENFKGVFPYQWSFGFVDEGQPVAYRGSHGTLELAVREGRGDDFLGGVKIGQILDIARYQGVTA